MPINKVGTRGIEDGAVATVDVAPGAVTSAKIADGGVSNDKLANTTAFGITLGGSSTRNDRFISWQSVVTTNTTMVAGRGYFVDTSSGQITMTLPASAVTGDTIAIKDYAANFDTNKITIGRNGHNIQGTATDASIDSKRASVELVYIDSTKGWLFVIESNVSSFSPFVIASGGTETTSGDYKIHTFTGDGNFVVSNVGPSGVGDSVSFMVAAGGGGGGAGSPNWTQGGGGGAGGFREGRHPTDTYTTSPLNNAGGLTVTAQTYPVTVGAGGTAGATAPAGSGQAGGTGSNSVFSTTTSAGGGGGAGYEVPSPARGTAGGSGGGGSNSSPDVNVPGLAGNTPPVSPPQGNPGGDANRAFAGPNYYQQFAGGGGGATAAGGDGGPTSDSGTGGAGGAGATTSITGSPVAYSGGGGGGGTGVDNQPGSGLTIPARCGDGGTGGGGNAMTVGRTHSPHGIPWSPTSTGEAGTANTGGGGGGGASNGDNNTPEFGRPGGAGGKGVVIIRYKYQ